MSKLPKPVEEFWEQVTPIEGAIATTELLLSHHLSPIRLALDAAVPILEMAEAFAEDNCECEVGFVCGNCGDIGEFRRYLAALETKGKA